MGKVISVENLSKYYRLGLVDRRTFRDDMLVLWNRFTGKPDPYGRTQSEESGIWALKDVNFEVEEGERIGIIGFNGAGKSTLLKIFSKITAPTSGRIKIKGKVASLLEVGTGFHPELTGRENIYLNGTILGMKRPEIEKKFDEIVEFSEIGKFIDTPVKRYSSGMYVRLAFAVAAHLEPEILVVDEVLAVGDFAFQRKCLEKMEDVSTGGRTVLFVSHNMGSINRLCNRAVLLRKGEVTAVGPTASVINKYMKESIAGEAQYSQESDPEKPMNLLETSVVNQEGIIGAQFGYDEPVTIRVKYEINEPVRGCYVGIELLTSIGVSVLTTADHDADVEMLEDRQPGVYEAEVAIPREFLNPGEYMVRIWIADGFAVVAYERVDALRFSVMDTGTPGSHFGQDSRRSLLQPIFPWQTKDLD
jgi:homopolymeric O-antigen transport system ATP-binding protein